MSENKKSFWSSIPGLVTGLAGLLTGVVGLVTVLIQLEDLGFCEKGDGPAFVRRHSFTHDGTFALDLASGEYDVIATIGDTSLAHDLVGVFLEGVQVDTITTAGGQTVTRTYRVSVSDGQLNLRLADLGGSDWWAMINALDVVFVGPDRTGPQVSPYAHDSLTEHMTSRGAARVPDELLVALKFEAGLQNAEIGEVLGLSESNVGTRLCRVVAKLRKTMA